MMTELVLVEGVSDVLLISYYLQNVYGWKHENSNVLGITENDTYEHIECLAKEDSQLILCGVGGNGKFTSFVEKHRVNTMLIEKDIASLMIVTDRDEDTDGKIARRIKKALAVLTIRVGQWISNNITDSFGQSKSINTYLLVVPADENGALERVIINTLKDIPEEADLIKEVTTFIDSLKAETVPELSQTNKSDKATVGTFFSIKNPQNAMRSFVTFISKIDWSSSESLRQLFLPFQYLGAEKPGEKDVLVEK